MSDPNALANYFMQQRQLQNQRSPYSFQSPQAFHNVHMLCDPNQHPYQQNHQIQNSSLPPVDTHLAQFPLSQNYGMVPPGYSTVAYSPHVGGFVHGNINQTLTHGSGSVSNNCNFANKKGQFPALVSPPQSYTCHKCGNKGHWITECTSNRTPQTFRPNAVTNKKTWYCEPCDKDFSTPGKLKIHCSSHEKCSHEGCTFEGTQKVVSAHHYAVHGKFSGSGFKMIDVEGQNFRVLLGTCPDEVAQWRAERRKFWPTHANIERKAHEQLHHEELGGLIVGDNKKRKRQKDNSSDTDGNEKLLGEKEEINALGDLMEVYADSDGHERVNEANIVAPTSKKKSICKFNMRGRCMKGADCNFMHQRIEQSDNAGSKKERKKDKSSGSLSVAKSNLLKNLLMREIRTECSLTLQCIRYISKTDFLTNIAAEL